MVEEIIGYMVGSLVMAFIIFAIVKNVKSGHNNKKQ